MGRGSWVVGRASWVVRCASCVVRDSSYLFEETLAHVEFNRLPLHDPSHS